MKFILDFCKGVLIGAGCILPGISSGVLCVVFGIYDKLIDSILNFFKDIRKNFKFLLPIALGGFIGIIIFSKFLQYLLYKFPLQTKSLFIGLILGGTVLLFKQMPEKQRRKITNFIYFTISLTIGILMVYFENRFQLYTNENISFFYLVISGFLMSVGIVVPGVSSTIILMLLGIYPLYLSSVSTLYLPVLIPIFIGVLIGSIIFMKIIKYLLDKYYTQTMFAIIGFTIGSILILVPEIYSIINFILALVCTLTGYSIIKILD